MHWTVQTVPHQEILDKILHTGFRNFPWTQTLRMLFPFPRLTDLTQQYSSSTCRSSLCSFISRVKLTLRNFKSLLSFKKLAELTQSKIRTENDYANYAALQTNTALYNNQIAWNLYLNEACIDKKFPNGINSEEIRTGSIWSHILPELHSLFWLESQHGHVI